MKTQHRLFALAASLIVAFAGATAAAATKKGGTFKWVDENGVTHFGDTSPPEYASQGHEELNSQGVTKRAVPRQLTPAEAAAAEKAAEEKEKREQHDAFLLNSYTNTADIERLRDERIAQIESQMELARISLATTNQRLAAQEARMKNFRPYAVAATAQRLPDRLAAEVVRTLSERRSMLTQLNKYEQDKETQRASFGADIARYKELTASK
jgi:hypothetical protein